MSSLRGSATIYWSLKQSKNIFDTLFCILSDYYFVSIQENVTCKNNMSSCSFLMSQFASQHGEMHKEKREFLCVTIKPFP